MENKIAEIESRIQKLESILKSIEFSGDALAITFNQAQLNVVNISGAGSGASFNNSPIGCATICDSDELESLEDAADDLECRIEDIKCAALDTRAILDEMQTHFDSLSKEIESLEAENKE